jgi:hemolysin activation/secretion protein
LKKDFVLNSVLRFIKYAACHIAFIADAQADGPHIAESRRALDESGRQDQIVEQRREAESRERIINAPGVRGLAPPPRADEYPPLPTEKLCFVLDTFFLDVPDGLPDAVRQQGASTLPQDRFSFAREWLEHYRGACVGKEGLNVLVKGLTNVIIARGYLTTRVLLSPQDISTGTLRLSLVPGIIGEIRFSDPDTRGTWKSALPLRAGELLNLRDLEQGLEQLKRVSSQDADIQVVPTDRPGESDIVIQVKRERRIRFVASVDNSGTRATGKLQGHLTLGIDNPLGLNDLLSGGYSQDLSFSDKRFGTHAWNAFYSVPWGYWTATISGYTSTYYQQIAGANETLVSSGNTQSFDFKLQRVIRRSQSDVLSVLFGFSKRFGANFIQDTEIPQHRRNNTFIELGLVDRHYFGLSQLDAGLSYRQGVGGFGALPDTPSSGEASTYRFRMVTLDANLSVPFKVSNVPLRYVTTLRAQASGNKLYYIDKLAIGSRYSVRGFDGENMLVGEGGFYWRNELQVPLGASAHQIYGGIDYGRIFGDTAQLAGTQLAGAVLGVRGSVVTKAGSLSYDVFAGKPIYKPKSFETSRWTVGFQLVSRF